MFHAGLQFRPCNALSKHTHTHRERKDKKSTQTKNKKPKKRCKLFCRPAALSIVMKMAEKEMRARAAALQLLYDGVAGRRETANSGRIMKIHICARTWREIRKCCRYTHGVCVLLATAGGGSPNLHASIKKRKKEKGK